MEFVKAMNEVGESYINNRCGMRNFNHVPTKSGYKMSIQCSGGHYCTPRILTDVEKYNTFEIAFLYYNDIDNCYEFGYPDFEAFIRKEELEKYYEGGIFAYVPKDLVEDVYKFLNT